MDRWIALIALTLIGSLAACADNPPYQRSAAYQPLPGGNFVGSGAAAGWGDFYGQGYGYANPLTDPGPAGAGRR